MPRNTWERAEERVPEQVAYECLIGLVVLERGLGMVFCLGGFVHVESGTIVTRMLEEVRKWSVSETDRRRAGEKA